MLGEAISLRNITYRVVWVFTQLNTIGKKPVVIVSGRSTFTDPSGSTQYFWASFLADHYIILSRDVSSADIIGVAIAPQ